MRFRMAAPRSSIASDEKIAQALQEEFDSEAAEEAGNAANRIIPGIEHLRVRCVGFGMSLL